MSLDYRSYPVLYVDDEPSNLVAVRYALDTQFTIKTARSGAQALEILQEDEIAVLVSDQRMPGMTGVELCEHASRLKPDCVRIIITAYADLHDAIDAIHRGRISRYLPKPFDNDELAKVLRTAIDLVHIQRTVRDLEVRLLRATATSTGGVSRELVGELDQRVADVAGHLRHGADLLLAAERTDDPERLSALLREARGAQNRGLEVAAALRSWIGRLEGTAPRPSDPPADLGRVTEQTVRLLESELRRVGALQLDVVPTGVVPISATDLGRLVTASLLWARDHLANLPAHGVLRVTAGPSDGTDARLEIRALGVQLSDEVRARQLDPFVASGTADLAGLRVLVERAGGQVEIVGDQEGEAIRVSVPLQA